MKTIAVIYLIWNILTLLLYGFDKLQAKKGGRRVPEKVLLLCALFMGGAGAFIGMELFRHKTKHTSFKILVPLFFAANIAALWWLGQTL